VLYPKEILRSKQPGKNEQVFFNGHVKIQADNESVLIVDKAEFLLQSVVIKLDDEFLGYLIKFVQLVTEGIETPGLAGARHEIFSSTYVDPGAQLNAKMNKERQKR